MLVAVHPTSEVASRAASALAGHPAVEEVGLIGRRPRASWRDRIRAVDAAAGYEVVVGDDAVRWARESGAVLVVTGVVPDDGPAVTHASPVGLARALGSRLNGSVRTLAATRQGDPAGDGTPIAFPRPVGWAYASGEERGVAIAPVPGSMGAVTAAGEGRLVGVVDDRRFLEAVCLAAGAFLAADALEGPMAVWERPDAYLAACTELGLVVADAELRGSS